MRKARLLRGRTIRRYERRGQVPLALRAAMPLEPAELQLDRKEAFNDIEARRQRFLRSGQGCMLPLSPT